jgi:hypothetical protein
MGAALDRGFGGEQSMGFYWGERGYFLIEGPSGAGGHAANASGFDGVAYNPTTGHMVIYDNKAFARAGNVYDASAVTTNFTKNIDGLIGRVQTMSDMPRQQDILRDLSSARAALNSPANWPSNVQVAVSNAGGQSTGVGGKLANGNISFINYNAAPSIRPAPPPPPSAPTSASTGKAWGGPGGTPGFSPSNIQNIGQALAMLQKWAEQLSMLNAAFAAWNEVLDRESEIIDAQNGNPLFPVYIRIYWKVHFENNPNMPKTYEYFGCDIQNGCAGMPSSLWDSDQHSYLMVIPALKKDDHKKASGPAATWRDGYTSVLGLLEGDRSMGGDPIAALRILNGSPMYDILRILQTLKASDPYHFDKLQQAISWPTANVGRDRLLAAFFAVQLSANSGTDAFSYYKASCKELASLPEDQQKDIETFLSGRSSADKQASTSPVGDWNVRVGKWLWIYKFDAAGSVTWRDPFNGENGKGKWKQGSGKLTIDWSPSKSKDTWYFPLDPKQQKGMAYVDDEGNFPVAATKL